MSITSSNIANYLLTNTTTGVIAVTDDNGNQVFIVPGYPLSVNQLTPSMTAFQESGSLSIISLPQGIVQIDTSLNTPGTKVNGSIVNPVINSGPASVINLGNFPTGGLIGAASATVDINAVLNIEQTTASQSLSLPTPTHTSNQATIFITNGGTASFTLLGTLVSPNTGLTAFWNSSLNQYVVIGTPTTASSISSLISPSISPGYLLQWNGEEIASAPMYTDGSGNIIVQSTLNAAPTTVQVGDVAQLKDVGGEIGLYDAAGINNPALIARKQFNLSSGTGSNFTRTRTLGMPFSSTVNPSYSVDSNSGGQTTTNNVVGRVSFIVNSTPLTAVDLFILSFSLRFTEAATGVRVVIRLNNENGPVRFKSHQDWQFEQGIGYSVPAFDPANPVTTTFLATWPYPLVLMTGETYYVRIENANQNVGMWGSVGTVIAGEFLPYFAQNAMAMSDDVVLSLGTGAIPSEFSNPIWGVLNTVDCSGGAVNISLPTAIGDGSGLPIYLVKVDNTVNPVTITPFAGQTMNGLSSIQLLRQWDSIQFQSDGLEPRIISYPLSYLTQGDVISVLSNITVSGTAVAGLNAVNATSNPITLTLPVPSNIMNGEIYVIKKTDSSANTVTVQSSVNIDGSTSYVLSSQYQSVRLVSDAITGQYWTC